MEKKVRFRILNKTAKTVTVKIGDKPITVSWDDYNKSFVTVDKFWAEFNEEEQKRHDQAEEAISWAVVHFMAMRAAENNPEKSKEYLVNALGLSHKMEEVQKLLGCSMLEATQIIKKRLMLMNPFMVNPMFTEEQMNRSGIHHKREHKPVERDENGNRKIATIEIGDTSKTTLGDTFSCLAELKEKMEKE